MFEALPFRALSIRALVITATVSTLKLYRTSIVHRAIRRRVVLGADVATRFDVAVPGTVTEVEAPLTLRNVSTASSIGLPTDDNGEQRADGSQSAQCNCPFWEMNQKEAVRVFPFIFIPAFDRIDSNWGQFVPILDFGTDQLGVETWQASDDHLEWLFPRNVVGEELRFRIFQKLRGLLKIHLRVEHNLRTDAA